jgi:ATP-dependent DNA helicase DinG
VLEEEEIPSADRFIDALFGERGYLSRAIPHYRPRPGQIAFAEAVDRAIMRRGHLLAEAGTGVGKSLGYAGPASYRAFETGRRVVIVTANIALQEQIVGKDLPLLQRIVPWDFTFALLKGRNNYLCRDRYEAFRRDKATGEIERARHTVEERRQLPIIDDWAHHQVEAGLGLALGDASELPFEPLHNVWRRFSVTSDECKRSKCRYRDECFAIAAAERARGAMVVVTNYHMLFAHIAAYLQTGFDLVINPFEVCILDEAHKAPDIARECFGFKIGAGTIHRIARKLEDELLAADLDTYTSDFFFRMGELAQNRDRYKARLKGDYTPEEMQGWEKLRSALAGASAELERAVQRRNELLQQAKDDGAPDYELDELQDEIGELEILLTRAREIAQSLAMAMAPREHTALVFFLESDDKRRTYVVGRLLHASDALTPGLFEKRVCPRNCAEPGPPVAVVATSATLATDSSDFHYIAEDLGVPPGYEALVAPSPFDWPNQALFCVPRGLPEPNAPEFKDAVASVMDRTIRLARGRTLGLFTSYRVLEHTFDRVRKTCSQMGITLLKQGDAPRTALIAQFKKDVSSVLFGTESFWAGVDVPGESLSVVVIDRLPFPTPDDPILDAIQQTDKEWFAHYSIPRSIVAFKQGFGRLVRSLECKGVVVCCDNRITEKKYGKKFLRSLPRGVPKTTNLDAIAEWLGVALPEAAAPPAAAPIVQRDLKPDNVVVRTSTSAVPPPGQLALFLQPPIPSPTLLPPGWDELDLPPPETLPPPAPAWDEP